MDDLKEAIRIIQEAVDTTPKDHPDLAMYLNNLGNRLNDRYSRTGAIYDLEEAIRIGREAVNATPKDHLNLLRYLNNLGNRLGNRYSRIGVMNDLNEAIRIIREVIEATPKDHPNFAIYLNNLGYRLGDRYLRIGAMDDLEEAIQIGREVIEATPKDHPNFAIYLNNLGKGLSDRYSRTGAIDDLKNASSSYEYALQHLTSETTIRLMAFNGVLKCCQKSSNWERACEAANTAIPLIPRLTPRSIENSDKQHMLSQIVGMASDAAAVVLNADRGSFHALKFLEQGRGVLATSLEEIRTDILDLNEKHPELAEQFDSLREELDSPITGATALVDENYIPSGQDRTSKRYDANKRLDQVIEQIRQQDGFEDFLLPPSKEEMLFAARFGSIVVINISEYRCDAILVEQHQIRSLNLPNLTKKEIEEKSVEILGTPKVLQWLWDVAVHPILEALGFTQPPSDGNWPHVWWIPTGPLSKFPLHAAGYHSKSSMESTLDRVMSSYSSSVKAIVHGRRRPVLNVTPHTSAHALLVAMQDTPNQSRLPFAKDEITILRSLCKLMDLVPLKAEPRMESVKLHLPKCKIFHFAGHGETNLTDPSQSSLLLEDGRLTVATLLEMNLRKSSPFLAYLSACGTGRIQDKRFLDESIHLISAYQLAGFRHVIGTLWEVNDESCVAMTRVTYEVMRDKGMSDESVCRGLHEAIRELRNCWLDKSLKKRHARRRVEKDDKISLGYNRETRNISNKERDARLPRKVFVIDSDDEDEISRGILHWVPYVHFGV
ncbi:hypothetical protein BPAE_0591g00040 [Botrytis paeoniae]|uniref:CHAT domain-containing protein n=1 Tax=Botrytis paeoniae TaxID=278948 RepID=A0A4Z1ES21_9HELO|nr:hypothetical protein BPAE_0591g00040 [Botrytis paeoniae]